MPTGDWSPPKPKKRKQAAAPAPSAAPVLDPIRVRSKRTLVNPKNKKTGVALRRYRAANSGAGSASTTQLGGIPKKVGAGR